MRYFTQAKYKRTFVKSHLENTNSKGRKVDFWKKVILCGFEGQTSFYVKKSQSPGEIEELTFLIMIFWCLEANICRLIFPLILNTIEYN